MNRGFYTAGSGLLTQQRMLNVMSNNVANIRTAGFKKDDTVSTTFEQELLVRLEDGAKYPLKATAAIVSTPDEVITDYSQGQYDDTNRPFDVAIAGEGFFTIKDPQNADNQLLTRNGQFDVDNEGYLILQGGGRVVGEAGEIKVNGDNFEIKQNGEVYVDGDVVDNLLIQTPADYSDLVKSGEGFYKDTKPETLLKGIPNSTTILQGSLERSNVNISEEMTKMISAQRQFQACSQVVKIIDATNQKAVSELGKI